MLASQRLRGGTQVTRQHAGYENKYLHPRKVFRSEIMAERPATSSVMARSLATATETGWAPEDFYSILGVHPAADSKMIKSAYYELMRNYHPDQSTAIDTNEFCALLNDIYKTLSDPEARSVYDAIAGFSADAINPFVDTSYPADQVFVDEVSCIGCGKCVRACPAAFLLEDSKYGRARVVQGVNAVQLEDDIQEAIDTCPVDCIHWVSSPQLSLLESALSGMARVDAFIMMRSHRSPGNVFEVAHRAWRKRQANISEIRKQHEYETTFHSNSSNSSSSSNFTSGWASFFNQHVEFRSNNSTNDPDDGDTNGYDGEAVNRDPERKHIANLAAAASRAMRRWRMHHTVVSATAQKVLCDAKSE